MKQTTNNIGGGIMSQVTVTTTDQKVKVSSAYLPELPSMAKKLGGRWDGSSWGFDIRDLDRVRDLYLTLYGDFNGEGSGETVSVRVVVAGSEWGEYRSSLFFAGRMVAQARGRDSSVILGDGVVVLLGGFRSGGSVKNWRTEATGGTVFEVRDIPKGKAEAEIADLPGVFESAEIIGAEMNKDALLTERNELMARVAEIDAILHA